ncbi:hypothetical protein RRG08_064900 [Elysia crispata]|uniref:Uncharacterized protein n=1 Tax=Elysia crispata TaxID=231223 RepID=A0AAE0ZRV9_9GAST|nr:hypothetical protein RRG08_064900 [Elysia crispata]
MFKTAPDDDDDDRILLSRMTKESCTYCRAVAPFVTVEPNHVMKDHVLCTTTVDTVLYRTSANSAFLHI